MSKSKSDLTRHHPTIAWLILLVCVGLTSFAVYPGEAGEENRAGATVLPTLVPLPPQTEGVPWPTKIWPEASLGDDVDRIDLAAATDALFASTGRGGVPDTRALLVVRHGRIVYERYAEGFGAKSRFHSWSMAKSFTQALVGILVTRGLLSLDDPAPVPEWQTPGDPRREITLRHLLNMTSGIGNRDFLDGDQEAGGFVAEFMFGEGAPDMAAFGANAPLVHPPGTHWAYSTATSAILARMIGLAIANDAAGRRSFIHNELLDPIGAIDAVFEFDRAGTFLGGSHVYATARDYARFGLLYLRDGVWDERRILPEGWVDFARSRAPVENNGAYGAHFWINHEPKEHQFELLPGGPTSAFEASGNAGQYIVVVPTHDLIIVRLGEKHAMSWIELNSGLAKLLEVFPEKGS